jgi:hypothetical protein
MLIGDDVYDLSATHCAYGACASIPAIKLFHRTKNSLIYTPGAVLIKIMRIL